MAAQTHVQTRQDDWTRDTKPRGGLATPQSRGAVSGILLMLLGVWGALIPFVGPYFSYSFTPDDGWQWTIGRFFLEVLPGAVAVVGGFLLVTARNRVTASVGAWAGVAAGGWYVVGPVLAPVIDHGWLGTPTGGTSRVAWEQLGFFYGLGGVVLLASAFALGRFSVVSVRDVGLGQRRAEERAAREAEVAAEAEAAAQAEARAAAARTAAARPVEPAVVEPEPVAATDEPATTAALPQPVATTTRTRPRPTATTARRTTASSTKAAPAKKSSRPRS